MCCIIPSSLGKYRRNLKPRQGDDATPEGLVQLFQPCTRGMLGSPTPSSCRRLTNRHKTLAGVSGFTLRRSSARLQAARRSRIAPVDVAAQKLFFEGMGITRNGDTMAAKAIAEFQNRFKEQLTDEMIAAMCEIFKLDDVATFAVEEALIAHGGPAALDHVGDGSIANA